MNNKKIIGIICKDLDQELSAGEKAELDDYLASSPEVHQIYRQQALIKKHLDEGQASMIEVDFKKNILNKITFALINIPVINHLSTFIFA